MQASLRQVRATASNYGRLVPPLTWRERERFEEILVESPGVLVEHPRQTLTFNIIAGTLRTTPVTLRRYFPDLDALIGEILHKHLRLIAEAFGEVPHGPDRARLCRLRYYNLTHTPMGAPNPQQLIMIRELYALPEDLRGPLAAMRHSLGVTMAGDLAEELLHFFENPCFTLADIEALLPPLEAARAAEFQALHLPPPATAPQNVAPPPAPEPEPESAADPQETAAPASPEAEPDFATDNFIAEPDSEVQTDPEPDDIHDEYSHIGIFDHAPSANDQFFAERGIPTRSRGPPK